MTVAAHANPPRRPSAPSSPSRVRGFRALALPLVVALLVGSKLSGCAHVPPYAREDLTRPGMESEREALEDRFRSHVYDAREGAAGGHGSTGGGCGCN